MPTGNVVMCMSTSLLLSAIFIKGDYFMVCSVDKEHQAIRDLFILILTLLHAEWSKLRRVLAVLSAIELKELTPQEAIFFL